MNKHTFRGKKWRSILFILVAVGYFFVDVSCAMGVLMLIFALKVSDELKVNYQINCCVCDKISPAESFKETVTAFSAGMHDIPRLPVHFIVGPGAMNEMPAG